MVTKKNEAMAISITAPNFQVMNVLVKGTAPLMQLSFPQKARETMMAKMAAGSTAKKGNKKEARDFDRDFEQAMHKSTEGWVGVPAAAIRAACIDVCRMTGFKMVHAKMSLFVMPDGNDAIDGTPLVRIISEQNPERTEMPVRNATGVADIRIRPIWRNWKLNLNLRYDADQFTASDVVNLLHRAGIQCGIGEGRPFSKQSYGLGFGTFEIVNE